MLVLPWPFSPARTLKRGPGRKVSGARFLTCASWRARSSRERPLESDAHRHDDADVLRVAGRANQDRVQLGRQLDPDALRLHLAEQLEHVLRVDADGDGRARVLRLELFLDL